MFNMPVLGWDADRSNPLWWSRLLPMPIREPPKKLMVGA